MGIEGYLSSEGISFHDRKISNCERAHRSNIKAQEVDTRDNLEDEQMVLSVEAKDWL